jgi:hypothetical protein
VLTKTLPVVAAALAGALLAFALVVRPAAKALRLWVVAS